MKRILKNLLLFSMTNLGLGLLYDTYSTVIDDLIPDTTGATPQDFRTLGTIFKRDKNISISILSSKGQLDSKAHIVAFNPDTDTKFVYSTPGNKEYFSFADIMDTNWIAAGDDNNGIHFYQIYESIPTSFIQPLKTVLVTSEGQSTGNRGEVQQIIDLENSQHLFSCLSLHVCQIIDRSLSNDASVRKPPILEGSVAVEGNTHDVLGLVIAQHSDFVAIHFDDGLASRTGHVGVFDISQQIGLEPKAHINFQAKGLMFLRKAPLEDLLIIFTEDKHFLWNWKKEIYEVETVNEANITSLTKVADLTPETETNDGFFVATQDWGGFMIWRFRYTVVDYTLLAQIEDSSQYPSPATLTTPGHFSMAFSKNSGLVASIAKSSSGFRFYLFRNEIFSCPDSCFNCNEFSECVLCWPNSATPMYTQTQTCVAGCSPTQYLAFGNSCLSSCPTGLKPKSSSEKICGSCPMNCDSCTYSSVCDNCKTGFLLFNDQCYDSCPDGTFQNLTHPLCHSCTSILCKKCNDPGDVCTECSSGFIGPDCSCPSPKFISAGQCISVETCPDGQFLKDGSCLECSENCATCEENEGICLSCKDSYTLDSIINSCKKDECSTGHALDENDECQKCVGCQECQNLTLKCIKKIFFFFSQEQDYFSENDISLRMNFLDEDSKALSFREIGFSDENQIAEVLKLKLEEKSGEIEVTYKMNEEGNVISHFDFTAPPETSKKFKIHFEKINSLDSIENDLIVLEGYQGTSEIEITYEKNFAKEEETKKFKKATEKISKPAAAAQKYSSTSTEILSVATGFLSADPSGSLFTFAQRVKLIARLRMLNFNQGYLLESFFKDVAEGYDEFEISEKLQNRRILLNYDDIMKKGEETSHQGKFSRFGVIKKITSKPMILVKILIYMLSWIVKYYLELFMKPNIMEEIKFSKDDENDEKKILKFEGKLRLFNVQKKVHFTLYNVAILNIAYFGTRNLLFLKLTSESFLSIIISFLAIIFAVVDSVHFYFEILKIFNFSKSKKKNFEKKIKLEQNKEKKNWENKNEQNPTEITTEGFSEEKLEKMGYRKKLDLEATYLRNYLNIPMKENILGILREKDEKLLILFTIAYSNFYNIFRMIVFHLTLVVLSNLPTLQALIPLLLEFLHLIVVLFNFVKYRYLDFVHDFIYKILQSLILSLFLVNSLIVIQKSRDQFRVEIGNQKFGVWCIIALIFIEYLYLVVNLIFIFIGLFKGKKKKEIKVIAFKWRKEPSLEEDDQSKEEDKGCEEEDEGVRLNERRMKERWIMNDRKKNRERRRRKNLKDKRRKSNKSDEENEEGKLEFKKCGMEKRKVLGSNSLKLRRIRMKNND